MDGLPVEPARVTRLTAIGREDAITRTDLIFRALGDAILDCETLIRDVPLFAPSADLLRRKLITLEQEAAQMKALADRGCAPDA